LHHFSSRILIDSVSASYHEVHPLEQNAALSHIATITPEIKRSIPITRVKVRSQDIAIVGCIPIQYHRKESLGMTAVKYEQLHDMKANDPTAHLDILWKTCFC